MKINKEERHFNFLIATKTDVIAFYVANTNDNEGAFY